MPSHEAAGTERLERAELPADAARVEHEAERAEREPGQVERHEHHRGAQRVFLHHHAAHPDRDRDQIGSTRIPLGAGRRFRGWSFTPMAVFGSRWNAVRMPNVIDNQGRRRRVAAYILGVELIYVVALVIAVPVGPGAVAIAIAFVLALCVRARLDRYEQDAPRR